MPKTQVLSCPDCRAEMLAREHGGVHLDLCEDCRTVWFDAGELESYRSSRDRALGQLPDPARAGAGATLGPKLRCPRCSSAMFSGTERRFEVHRCPSCAGLYCRLPLPATSSLRKLVDTAMETLGLLAIEIF